MKMCPMPAHARWISVFIAVVVSCGGGGGGATNNGSDAGTPDGGTPDAGGTTAPEIHTTTPASNATNVPLNATINATFSRVMSSASIVEATFAVDPTVPGTVTYGGTTATLTPRSPLAFATTYTATITRAAKDLAGNPLAADYNWSFTTVPAPPTVASTDPANNATSVGVNATVNATFSEAMSGDSITASSFRLAPAVAGTVSLAGATATLTPGAALAFSTTYTSTITTAAKSLDGVPLAAD